VHTDKSKVEILQNFVAFSEYININIEIQVHSQSHEEALILIS
jgi:hypothetical protein